MATSGRINYISGLPYLDIKESNKIIKEKQVSKLEQQYIKPQRRRNRMETYRRESQQRHANVLESLMLKRDRLQAELASLSQEIFQLRYKISVQGYLIGD